MKPGQPCVTRTCTLKIFKRQVDVNPRITAHELKEKNPRLFSQVALCTIRHRLHDNLKFKQVMPRKKPLLTERQRKNRLVFAKKYVQWDLDEWRKVLWSDEATFQVTGSRRGKVYLIPDSNALDPKFVQHTVKFPDSLMVWGCFGYCDLGDLVFLPHNVSMSKDIYLELLCDNLPDSFQKTMCSVFMEDGAPCHTAKLIKDWFNFSGVDYIKDWPDNSLDSNPNKNLWALIKDKL